MVGPSAPSGASHKVSEIPPRAGRRLHLTNAWPSVIEARRNRNALRRRRRHRRRNSPAAGACESTSPAHAVAGLYPTNSGKGSPSALYRTTPVCTRSDLVPIPEQAPAPGRELRIGPRPRPHPKSTQPTREIGSTGPRPGDAHPFRRSGQLAPVAGDAPGASTPPRRREPGR